MILLLLQEEKGKQEYFSDMGDTSEVKPLCLVVPFFGRTANNIIQLGKILNLVHIEGKNRRIALDAEWSRWFQSNFDMREEVLLGNYSGNNNCEKIYNGRKAFFQKGWNLTHLINLVPSQEIRNTAAEIVESWPHGQNFVSVHRRDLEGSCHLYVKCVKVRHLNCTQIRDRNEKCSASIRHQACDMEYEMAKSSSEGLPVVLFSDGQVPSKDATFPTLFRHDNLLVEMWMMAMSKTHWGNPKSAMDIVVAGWRRGYSMEPKKCYGPTNIVYRP